MGKVNENIIEVPPGDAPVKVEAPRKKRKKFPFQGYIEFQGLKIDIENVMGSYRRGVAPDGRKWATYMHFPYGEIRGSEGVDGDRLDVYIGPNADSPLVVVIHQQDPDSGRYDEDKVMLGFNNVEEAVGGYKRQYDRPGFYKEGEHTTMNIGQLNRLLEARKGKRMTVKAFVQDADLMKGGPYYGPRGGKWADPRHTIPWDQNKHGSKKPGGRKKQAAGPMLPFASKKEVVRRVNDEKEWELPAGARVDDPWAPKPIPDTARWKHPDYGNGTGAAPWQQDADWAPDLKKYDILLVNSSAGKDSQATLTQVVQKADEMGVPRDKIVVVHCDLGERVEWSQTKELAQKQAEFYGAKFHVVTREQGDLVDQIDQRHGDLTQRKVDVATLASAGIDTWGKLAVASEEQVLEIIGQGAGSSKWPGKYRAKALLKKAQKAVEQPPKRLQKQAEEAGVDSVANLAVDFGQAIAWPSMDARFCTSDHKRDVVKKLMTKLVKEHQEETGSKEAVKVLNILGIRAQESPGREKMDNFVREETTGKREVDRWYPIHRWHEERVWKTIKESGVAHHTAYNLGMRRLSCAFCVFASKEDLMIAAQHNPEMFQTYLNLEAKLGSSFAPDKSLSDIRDAIAERRSGDEGGTAVAKALGLHFYADMVKAESTEDLVGPLLAAAHDRLTAQGEHLVAVVMEWKPQGACVHLDTEKESYHVSYLPYPDAYNGSIIAAGFAQLYDLQWEEHNEPPPLEGGKSRDGRVEAVSKAGTFTDLVKGKEGGKYIKKIPKPGGGFTYVYPHDPKTNPHGSSEGHHASKEQYHRSLAQHHQRAGDAKMAAHHEQVAREHGRAKRSGQRVSKQDGGLLGKPQGTKKVPADKVTNLFGQKTSRKETLKQKKVDAKVSGREAAIRHMHNQAASNTLLMKVGTVVKNWTREKVQSRLSELKGRKDKEALSAIRALENWMVEYFAKDLDKKEEKSRRRAKKAMGKTFTDLVKGGPYIGKRGGKWADAQHTIPWKEGKTRSQQRKTAHADTPGRWHNDHKATTVDQHDELRDRHHKLANEAASRMIEVREHSNAYYANKYEKEYHRTMADVHGTAKVGKLHRDGLADFQKRDIDQKLKQAAVHHRNAKDAKELADRIKPPEKRMSQTPSGKDVKFLSTENFTDETHTWSKEDHEHAALVHRAHQKHHDERAKQLQGSGKWSEASPHSRSAEYHERMGEVHERVAKEGKGAVPQLGRPGVDMARGAHDLAPADTSPTSWENTARNLLDSSSGKGMDDFHYRAYLRAVVSNDKSMASHLANNFDGAQRAREHLIDEYGKQPTTKKGRDMRTFTDLVKSLDLRKGGPYMGPRGGKWADPEHKIPWDESKHSGKAAPKAKEHDEHGARELQLFIDNTGELHNQYESIRTNLAKKIANGNYDHAQATKLFEYLVDAGSKQYNKEMGGPAGGGHHFSPATRRAVARSLANDFHDEVKDGEHNHRVESGVHAKRAKAGGGLHKMAQQHGKKKK